MKTIIERTMRHGCSTVYEFRFRAACWWLNQQVEFLEWRLRLETMILPEESTPMPKSAGQERQYVVHTM
ncbi:MAG TPA: hypothetical protein VLA67_13465 [Nitrospiraceae bacterium]|nr:hypothetical protein [Nitrospiraceae bacterium]